MRRRRPLTSVALFLASAARPGLDASILCIVVRPSVFTLDFKSGVTIYSSSSEQSQASNSISCAFPPTGAVKVVSV